MNASATQQVDYTRRRVRQHFHGIEESRAIKSLEVYLSSYTGRAFESLADLDVDRITANNLVAVGALSAPIPAEAAILLLDGGMQRRISGLLRAIPDVAIWDDRADLSRTGGAWELCEVLRAVDGLGPVRTSKLMASKRPALIPIADQHVAESLCFGSVDYWALMQSVLRDGALRDRVFGVAREAGGAHLSTLRTIDIVVWMRQHGYASLDDAMAIVDYNAPLPPDLA